MHVVSHTSSSMASCWIPCFTRFCLLYHIITTDKPTTTNIKVNKQKNNITFTCVDFVWIKMHFSYWFGWFATRAVEKHVNLHVDQTIYFISVTNSYQQLLHGWRLSVFLERLSKTRIELIFRKIKIAFELWNGLVCNDDGCFLVRYMQTNSRQCSTMFFGSENSIDWHGQMESNVCALNMERGTLQ